MKSRGQALDQSGPDFEQPFRVSLHRREVQAPATPPRMQQCWLVTSPPAPSVPQTVVSTSLETLMIGAVGLASGLARPAARAISFKPSLRSERVVVDGNCSLWPKKSITTDPGESVGASGGSSQMSPCFSFMPILAIPVPLSSRKSEKSRVSQSRSSTYSTIHRVFAMAGARNGEFRRCLRGRGTA